MSLHIQFGRVMYLTHAACLILALTLVSVFGITPSMSTSTTPRAPVRGGTGPGSSSTGTGSGSPSGGWNVLTFPNPQQDVNACGRGKPSWVCDPTGVLSRPDADKIDLLINDMKAHTGGCKCPDRDDCPKLSSNPYGGYQPAVAVVDTMTIRSQHNSPSSQEKKQAAYEFAEHLRDEKWEFGECNDDFVIFISRDDRQVFTATGEITRLILTDRCIKDIFKNNTHHYKAGKFGEGIKSTVLSYLEVFHGVHPCTKSAGTGSVIGAIIGVIIALIITVLCCVCCCKRKGGGGGDVTDKAAYAPVYHPHDEVRRASKASSVSLESGGGGGEF